LDHRQWGRKKQFLDVHRGKIESLFLRIAIRHKHPHQFSKKKKGEGNPRLQALYRGLQLHGWGERSYFLIKRKRNGFSFYGREKKIVSLREKLK